MRVAEQVASIDQASGGRLEVGLLPTAELVGEGDLGWQEGFRMLVEMWDEPTFSWTSPRFTVRPVDVVPKPAQHPHPAIWLVGWSVEHAIAAGLGGLGYLDVSGADVDMLEVHRDAYSESRAGIDPNDLVSTHTFGVAGDLEDGEEGADQLAAWEALGVDHAIARAGPLDGGHDESISLIRNLTSAATDVL
jgi:alkanesulfonate monooxygenase SsuD/methylene tetrahydromethanopterin reductase-like flavin-dependent oxidoreductase (luciferase family)